jgi:hypothetical protein
LILKHLLIANSLLILSKGIPHTIFALGLKYFSMILTAAFSCMFKEWVELFPSTPLAC